MPTARLIQTRGALAGASVVVTRPTATAQTLKRRVRALGGAVLALPGLALRASADPTAARSALGAVRSADAVIFVSPAAVKYAFALQPNLRIARGAVVAALGAATARALARRGLRNVLWPRRRQDSEGLLALAPLQRPRGQRVVVIGAPEGRDLLGRSLRQRRARLTHVHVYCRVAPRYTARQLAALECAPTPLLMLLSSAQALVNLRAQVPLALFARLAAGELIVSSARLAAIARRSLFANVHVAASANPRDLLSAAVLALARHRL